MAQCKFCGGEITWVKEGRRNMAVNPDTTSHKCEEMKRSMKTLKEIALGSLTTEEIARYELGINNKAKK